MYQDYCNTVMWVVVVGFFFAANYRILAHLDDVARGVGHATQMANPDRHTSPPSETPNTQNLAESSSRSSLPREIFVEFIAEALWDLLKRRNRP
jgi:hypothetical protein